MSPFAAAAFNLRVLAFNVQPDDDKIDIFVRVARQGERIPGSLCTGRRVHIPVKGAPDGNPKPP